MTTQDLREFMNLVRNATSSQTTKFDDYFCKIRLLISENDKLKQKLKKLKENEKNT